MRTFRTVASLIIGLGGLAMMAWAIYVLLQTGTCGTGGPYQIAKPCPPGSGLTGWLLIGGFFAWYQLPGTASCQFPDARTWTASAPPASGTDCSDPTRRRPARHWVIPE